MTNQDITKQAILFYINYIDMDFLDYAETLDTDIEYIKDLIKKHGPTKAREILDSMKEGR